MNAEQRKWTRPEQPAGQRWFATDKSRFLLVGACGFCVDGLLLTLLLGQGWSTVLARLISFPSAVSCTWCLNRLWTFHNPSTMPTKFGKKFWLYVSIQCLGAGLNFGLFVLLIQLMPRLTAIPMLPLAAAAAVSMAFNYLGAKYLVFR